MKVVKRLVFVSFLLVVIAVSLYNDALVAYATEFLYNATTLPKGTVLKSGDLFNFDFEDEYQDRCQGAAIGLSLDYNQFRYLYFMNSITGEMTDKNSNYYGIGGINIDAFEQKKIPEMPYVEGKEVLWVYQGGTGIGGYCFTDNHFVGHIYEAPEFNIYCDSTEMGKDDKVACQVTVEYSDVPTNVEFEINSKDFNISDIEVMDEWKRTDDEKFVFEAFDIPTNKYDDSRVEVDIIEFFITPKNEEFEKVDNAVTLENVSWKDDYVEKKLEDIKYEPMQPIKKQDVDILQTGVESYILLGIIISCLGVLMYRKANEKGLFKRL